MAVSTSAGARFFIGPVVNPDTFKALTDEQVLTAFEAIAEEDWTELEEVESLGEVGDSSEVATFTSLKDRRVRKFKTTRDAGTMTIVVGRDGIDPGQDAMTAAEKTDFNYRFRIIYNDEREEAYSPSTEYFAGMVLNRPTAIGAVTDITKRTFSVGVNSAIYEDPTDPTGS